METSIPAPPYFAKDICAAADIKPTTLNTWRVRLRPLPPGSPKSLEKPFLEIEREDARLAWTQYTANDLIRVCALAHLVRNGIDLAYAAEIADIIKDFDVEPERLSKPLYINVSLGYFDFEARKKWGSPGLQHLSRSVKVSFSDELDDCVAIVIDLSKIYAKAMQRLRRERT